MLKAYSDYFTESILAKPSCILYMMRILKNDIKTKNPSKLKKYVFYSEFSCNCPYSKKNMDIIRKAFKTLGYDVKLFVFKIIGNAGKKNKYYYKFRIES